VFAYLDSPGFHVDADLVSNNHFDEDGLMGILALTAPSLAEKHRDLLVDAANAGDFGVYRQRDAARIVFTVSAYADPNMSPLPKEVFQLPYPRLAARLYQQILELLPRLLTGVSDYRQLWEMEDAKLTATEELAEKGEITIEERPGLDLAIVHGPENLAATVVHRFTQTRLAELHPFALHNRTKFSRLLIVRGQHVEFQYRYESWVQLASRRPPARVDLTDLAAELNQHETSGGRWVFDGVDRLTPRMHLEGSAATSLSPDVILQRLEHHLTVGLPGWQPYDE
jgi:hypothetical protein